MWGGLLGRFMASGGGGEIRPAGDRSHSGGACGNRAARPAGGNAGRARARSARARNSEGPHAGLCQLGRTQRRVRGAASMAAPSDRSQPAGQYKNAKPPPGKTRRTCKVVEEARCRSQPAGQNGDPLAIPLEGRAGRGRRHREDQERSEGDDAIPSDFSGLFRPAAGRTRNDEVVRRDDPTPAMETRCLIPTLDGRREAGFSSGRGTTVPSARRRPFPARRRGPACRRRGLRWRAGRASSAAPARPGRPRGPRPRASA
jgi:hypothetical protein